MDRYFPPGPANHTPGPRSFAPVKEENWGELKKHFRPQFIGLVVITPPWHEVPAVPGQVVVKIDPDGLRDGTHPSTVLSCGCCKR